MLNRDDEDTLELTQLSLKELSQSNVNIPKPPTPSRVLPGAPKQMRSKSPKPNHPHTTPHNKKENAHTLIS